jgi:hypothetical protein
MEESCFYVEAHDFEVMVVGKGEKETDTNKFDNGGVCLTVVFRSLAKALGNQPGLLLTLNNSPIRMILIVIRPA